MKKQPTEQARAAKEIRAILKTEFPETKFSVTSESFAGGDAVNVSYTDGPTREQVETKISHYQYGHFNGMEDIYEYSNSREDIPQTKYLSVSREMSEEARAEIAAEQNINLDEYDPSNAIYREFAQTDFRLTKEERAAAKIEKEEQERKAFEEYQKQQKIKKLKAQAERRITEEKVATLQDIEFIDIEEEEQYFIETPAAFSRKAGKLEFHDRDLEEGAFSDNKTKVVREVNLTDAEMDIFVNNFYEQYQWLAEQGGTDTTSEMPREVNSFSEYTPEEWDLYRAGAYNLVVRVTSDSLDLLIDPQGHSYARYVAYTPNCARYEGCEESFKATMIVLK